MNADETEKLSNQSTIVSVIDILNFLRSRNKNPSMFEYYTSTIRHVWKESVICRLVCVREGSVRRNICNV